MAEIVLSEFPHLSGVCQRIGKRKIGGKTVLSWFLVTAKEARMEELRGNSIRCAFCCGRIKLMEASKNGIGVPIPRMEHFSDEDSKHCIVGVYYDGGKLLASRAPVGKEIHESGEDRCKLSIEAVRRFPNCLT